MDYYIMKDGTLIVFDKSFIVDIETQCILSNKTGQPILDLDVEVEDFRKQFKEWLDGLSNIEG